MILVVIKHIHSFKQSKIYTDCMLMLGESLQLHMDPALITAIMAYKRQSSKCIYHNRTERWIPL